MKIEKEDFCVTGYIRGP